ncbi:MAG TPA: adenosylmethionine--8-amino-7-oxononanoate transaminase [Cyclobacteriaceae bacterium]
MSTWKEKDQQYIWHPFTALEGSPDPIHISSAQGIYLHTDDGRKIIDAISSWWVNLHGHSHPVIVKAIAEQAQKLEHVIFAGFTHEPAIQLAENLLKILPKHFSKVFFSDNGSTAVEVAIKLAIQYWRNQEITKNRIIALEGAYHGDTFGAMAVGDRGAFTSPFHDHLFTVDFLKFPTPENEDIILNDFTKLIKSNQVAAFIFEPLVQAAGGMRMYSADFLDKLIALSKEHKVITIADEVFTGFGRTGKLFACDYLMNKPDLIALSKGITGGSLPLGVTVCSEQIVKVFQSKEIKKTFFHGHSFTANPISCAAANASYQLLTDPDCLDQINLIGLNHLKFIDKVKKLGFDIEARSLGTILAIELNTKAKTSYFNLIRDKLYSFFLERNILLRPLGNVLYFLPPYVITQSKMDIVYNAIEDFLREEIK